MRGVTRVGKVKSRIHEAGVGNNEAKMKCQKESDIWRTSKRRIVVAPHGYHSIQEAVLGGVNSVEKSRIVEESVYRFDQKVNQ